MYLALITRPIKIVNITSADSDVNLSTKTGTIGYAPAMSTVPSFPITVICGVTAAVTATSRSEEHTSELQSH